MDSIPLALTYDDVLLVPRFSSIQRRRDVDCSAKFTKQITLKTPFVSANMDSVTESSMAIAMAEYGGIGVIHRFLPIPAQVAEVTKVKRYQSTVIDAPHTISANTTVGEAWRLMEQLEIHGLPVVDGQNKLLGMLSNRDLRFADDDALVSERMTPRERLVVVPRDISTDKAKQILSEHRLEKLPQVDDQDCLVGLFTARDLSRESGFGRSTRDDKGCLRVASAVGGSG